MFIRKYGENLSSPTFLELPNDAKWKVELTECNDEVWLQKGWKEFAKCYSLKQGHFVVFRYEGNSHFQVLIFDETATKIDYHSNSSHGHEDGKFDEKYEVPNMEDDESDSSVLTVLPCRGRPHMKMKSTYTSARIVSQKSNVRIRIQKLTRKDKAKALKKVASAFKLKNPYFMVVMQPSFVQAYGSVRFVISGKVQGSFSAGWAAFVKENNLQVGDTCVV
nr:b3 domain-containing transcription factor vrn1 [Quercus suber]